MLFSDSTIVDLLNQYCVTVTINVFPVDPHDGVDPADAAWVKKNAPQLAYLLNQAIRLGPAIVSPDWKTSRRVFMEHQNEMGQATIKALEDAVREFKIEKKPPVLRPSTPIPAELTADDLLIRVSSRFLTEGQTERPVDFRLPTGRPFRVPLDPLHGGSAEVRSMYELRLRKPLATREWVILRPQQCGALLPPAGKKVGDTWDVEPAVATELLWLFRPSTHQFRISRDDVKTVALKATLESPTEVRLEGAVRIRQYWFPTSNEGIWRGDLLVDDYWAETAVGGHLTFDPTTRKISALSLASDEAMYRGIDNTQLPYAVVAYAVNPRTVGQEELATK